MDLCLLSAYRLLWADIVLIHDACLSCYHLNKLTLKDMARALQLILQHENDIVYNSIAAPDTVEYTQTSHLAHDAHEFSSGEELLVIGLK